MAEDGHDVYIFAPGAFSGGQVKLLPNLTVLSADFGDDRWGNKTLDYWLYRIKPDIVITWLDCQGLACYGWSETPVIMWSPIDTWPLPKQEKAILGRAARVLVPSKWGQQVLADADVDSDYVPCGIDLSHYNIYPAGRARWRAQMRPEIDEGTFLIGMVGLNSGMPDRKGYGYAFDVIKALSERHNNIRVYIHTNAGGDGMSINLVALREEMGLEDVICFSRPLGPLGESPEYLRDMYNAFDVLLHCGNSEGFGMPIVEAQACGTPVVANAASSVTELLGSTSFGAEPGPDFIVNTCTRIALPSVANLLEKLEEAYSAYPADRARTREVALPYEQDALYDTLWRPILARLPESIVYGEHGSDRLMLAAGRLQKAGFVHHDREKFWDHIDVAHDLNVLPWPWADDSWDYIEFSDCLEHLAAETTDIMDELWRVLRPGGYVYIHTAEAGSWQLNMDPTHRQGYMINSFDYYDPDMRLGSEYNYSERKWRVCKRSIDDSGLVFVLQPRKEPHGTTTLEPALVGAGVVAAGAAEDAGVWLRWSARVRRILLLHRGIQGTMLAASFGLPPNGHISPAKDDSAPNFG